MRLNAFKWGMPSPACLTALGGSESNSNYSVSSSFYYSRVISELPFKGFIFHELLSDSQSVIPQARSLASPGDLSEKQILEPTPALLSGNVGWPVNPHSPRFNKLADI